MHRSTLTSLILVVVLLLNQILMVHTALAIPQQPIPTPPYHPTTATADLFDRVSGVPEEGVADLAPVEGQLLFAPALDSDGDPATNPVSNNPVTVMRIGETTAGVALLAAQIIANGPRQPLIRIPVTIHVWNEQGTVYEEIIESDAWGAVQAEVRLLNPDGEYRYQVKAPGFGSSEIRAFQFDVTHPGLTVHATGAELSYESREDGTLLFTLRSPEALEVGRDDPALIIARRPIANDSNSLFQPILQTVNKAGLRLPFPRVPMQIIDAHTAQLEVQLPMGDYRFVGSLTVNSEEANHYFTAPIEKTLTAHPTPPAATEVAWVANLEHEAGQTLVQYDTPKGKAIFALVDSTQRPALMAPLPLPNRHIVQSWRVGAFEWIEQRYQLSVGAAAEANNLAVSLDSFDYDLVAHRYDLSLRSLATSERRERVNIEVLGVGGIVIHSQSAELSLNPNQTTAYSVEVPAEVGKPKGIRMVLATNGKAKQTLLTAELTAEERVAGALAPQMTSGDPYVLMTVSRNVEAQMVRAGLAKRTYNAGFSVVAQVQLKLFINVLEVEVATITWTYPVGIWGGEEPDWIRIGQQAVEGFLGSWWTDAKLVIASGGFNVAADIGVRLTVHDENCPDGDWETRVGLRLKLIADSIDSRLQDAMGENDGSFPIGSPPVPIVWLLMIWAEGVLRVRSAADAEGLSLQFTFKLEVEVSVNFGIDVSPLDIVATAKSIKAIATYVFIAIDILLYLGHMSEDTGSSRTGGGCAGDNWNPNPPDGHPPDDRQDVWQAVGHLVEREDEEATIGNLNTLIARARARGLSRAETYLLLELRDLELQTFATDVESYYDYIDAVDAIAIENNLTLRGILSGTIPIEPTQTITEALVFQNEQAAAQVTGLTYGAELRQVSDNYKVAQRAYMLLYEEELELQRELRDLLFNDTIGVIASGFPDATLAALEEAGIPGQLISLWQGSRYYGLTPSPYLAPDLAPRALVVPSGGMHRIAGSPEARAWLEAYVSGGGTLLVFTQAFGSDWNALPGGEVYGVGYEEDQRCEQESVRAAMPSPWLAWMGVATPDIQVDGAFTGWPANANILLLRQSGLYQGYPAMIEYPFGAGRVVATSAYGDWTTQSAIWWGDDWQMTRTMLIRALLLAQGQDIGDLLTAPTNSDTTITFPITNTTSVSITNVAVELPVWRNRLPGYTGNHVTVPIAITPGSNATVNALIHTPPAMRGVHNWTQVGLFNIRATAKEENNSLFNYYPRFFHLQSPLAPLEVGVTLTADPVTAYPNQPTTVTATVRNFTDEERTVQLRGIRDLPTSGVMLTIPAHGSATHSYPLIMNRSRFPKAAIYAGTTQLALASLAVYVSDPNLSATPTLPTVIEEGATITVTVANRPMPLRPVSASMGGEVRLRLYSPFEPLLWNDVQPFEPIQINGSVSVPFTISELPPNVIGNYILVYEIYEEGELRTEGQWEIASTVLVRGEFDQRDYHVRENLTFTATLHNEGLFDLAPQVTVEMPELGIIATQSVSLPVNSYLSIPISATLPPTLPAGTHPFTVRLVQGGIKEVDLGFLIPASLVSLIGLSSTTAQAGDTLTVTLQNNGGADTTVEYTLFLADERGVIIAEEYEPKTIQASGGTTTISLPIPEEAATGTYQLVLDGRDMNSNQHIFLQEPITITGIAATLEIHPDQTFYGVGDSIGAEGSVTATTGTVSGTLTLAVNRVTPDDYTLGTPERVNDNQELGFIAHADAAVTYDGAGNAYAVWADQRNGTYDVFFSHRPVGESWGASTQVSDATTGIRGDPDLAVDSAGTVYVVWADSRNGDSDIYFASRPAGGSWSVNERVNDVVTGDQGTPSITVTETGTLYVAWMDDSNPTFNKDIYFAERPVGGTWSAHERVNDDSTFRVQDFPDMVVSQDGTAHLIWLDIRNNNQDVYYASRPVGGTWSANVQINSVTMPNTTLVNMPVLAIDSADMLYAAWLNDANSTLRGLYVASRPAGGGWGTNQRVTTFTPREPALAVDSSGTVHLLWNRNSDIQYANRPLATGTWSTALTIHSNTSAIQTEPTLAVAPNGNLLAAWSDNRHGAVIIYADERPAATGTWGTDYLLSDVRGGANQTMPDLTVASDGTLFAVWEDLRSRGPGSNEEDIYFATRHPDGPWEPSVPVHNSLGTVVLDQSPSIALDGADNAYVLWSSGAAGPGGRIHFAIRDAATGMWSARTAIPGPTNNSVDPDIAVDAVGNSYAIWTLAPSGGWPDVYFSYRPAGGNWTTGVKVNDNSDFNTYQQLPSIAVDGEGNAYAVWQDLRELNDSNIYFSYRPAGGSWGANVRANDEVIDFSASTYPQITVDHAGNAYLVWMDTHIPGANRKPYFAYRPALGSWSASEEIPGALDTCSTFSRPSIQVDENGTVTVAWSQCGVWMAQRSPDGIWGDATQVMADPPGNDWLAMDIDNAGNAYLAWQYPDAGMDIGSAKVTLPVGSMRVWEQQLPINTSTAQLVDEAIGTLEEIPGKYWLSGTMQNSLFQTLATDRTPFYIFPDDVALTLETDASVYRPNDTITITGYITNTNSSTTTLTLQLKANGHPLINQPYSLAPGAGVAYSTTYQSTNDVLFTATAGDAIISEQALVAEPTVEATLSVPDLVSGEPFSATLLITNTGIITVALETTIGEEATGTLLLPPGVVGTVARSLTVEDTILLNATVRGDVTLDVETIVQWGEGGSLEVLPPVGTTEGLVGVEYVLHGVNSDGGFLNIAPGFPTSAILSYQVDGGAVISESLILYPGQSLTNTLLLTLTAGSHVVEFSLDEANGEPLDSEYLQFSVAPNDPGAEAIIEILNVSIGLERSADAPPTLAGDSVTLGVTVANHGVTETVVAGIQIADTPYQWVITPTLYTTETFYFDVELPDDLPAGTYTAQVVVDDQSIPFTMDVAGVDVGLALELDATAYTIGEQVNLTVTLDERAGISEDYPLALRYGTSEDVFTATVAAGATVQHVFTFTATESMNAAVTLANDTPSGQRVIMIDSLPVKVIDPTPGAYLTFDQTQYEAGEAMTLTLDITGTLASVMLVGPKELALTSDRYLMWYPPITPETAGEVPTGTYTIPYTFPETLKTGRYTFDLRINGKVTPYTVEVRGWDVYTRRVTLNQNHYEPGDTITATAEFVNAGTEPITDLHLTAFVFKPNGDRVDLSPVMSRTVTLEAGLNEIELSGTLLTDEVGSHRVVINVGPYGEMWRVAGAAAQFDVGAAHLVMLSTDKGNYTPGEAGTGRLDVYGMGETHLLVTASTGATLLDTTTTLSGFDTFTFTIPTASEGDYLLVATSTDMDGMEDELIHPYAVPPAPDVQAPIITLTLPTTTTIFTSALPTMTLTVAGTVSDNREVERVLVNGEVVTPTATGEFTTTLTIRQGLNGISATALDPTGNIGYTPVVMIYLLPARQATIEALPSPVVVNETITFQTVLTASALLNDVLWLLPLPTTAFTDVIVSATGGTIRVNTLNPARHDVVWQGDVGVEPPEEVTLTVSARTIQTGTIPLEISTFWGWGTRESDMLTLTVLEIPTGVTLADFTAAAIGTDIRITWETASERDNLGFNLWRATTPDSPTEQLNDELIMSQSPGGGQGAFYEWTDGDVMEGPLYHYWLDAVSIDGTITRYGPVTATVLPPTAVTFSRLDVEPLAREWQGSTLYWHMGWMGLLCIAAWLWRRRIHKN